MCKQLASNLNLVATLGGRIRKRGTRYRQLCQAHTNWRWRAYKYKSLITCNTQRAYWFRASASAKLHMRAEQKVKYFFLPEYKTIEMCNACASYHAGSITNIHLWWIIALSRAHQVVPHMPWKYRYFQWFNLLFIHRRNFRFQRNCLFSGGQG